MLKTYLHHKNFRLISQENLGAGAARNAGIRTAKAWYVYFVDSGDFLLPDILLLGYVVNPDCDVIEFRGIKLRRYL